MLVPKAHSDKVIVTPVSEQDLFTRKFVVPDIGKEKAQLAQVFDVGEGFYNAYLNEIKPCAVKKGDLVLVPKIGATSFTIDGDEYYVCREIDLLAIIIKTDD